MNINDLVNINFSQRNLTGLCIVLAALIAFTFFYSFWQWRNDWILAHQTTNSIPTIAKSDETKEMIAAIPDEHLFGKSFSKSGEVPITNLQLQVTGIVKVETEQSSTTSKAYISISGQPSKIYQVGDSLPYGVKVYDITSDTVILENDGHFEKLPLPRQPLKFKPKTSLSRDVVK